MIEIKSVTKKYDDFTAIKDINLTVDDGSVLALAGFNGCGKTTLLNVCAGIFKADNGAVYLNGEDVFDNNSERKKLFYLSDHMWFPTGATIKAAAKCYASYLTNFDFNTLNALCDLFGLDINKPVKGFSKGMTRQAGLAIALAAKPSYLLIDETFDGLDPHKKEIVRKLLLQYINELEASVIISSHDLTEIASVCDHIAILNGSRVVVNSSIDDVSNNYRKVFLTFSQPVTEEFFSNFTFKTLKTNGKNVIVTLYGDIDSQLKALKAMEPISIEDVPLTLEEVFSAETEVQNDNEKIKRIFK